MLSTQTANEMSASELLLIGRKLFRVVDAPQQSVCHPEHSEGSAVALALGFALALEQARNQVTLGSVLPDDPLAV
jgi:hypothetical protein